MVTLLLGLFIPAATGQFGPEAVKRHEARMAKWRPATRYEIPPGTPVREGKVLLGNWSLIVGNTTLDIRPVKAQSYDVRFSTSGCLGMWSARRKGKFTNGVLMLNRGVEPYCGRAFDRLFLVRADSSSEKDAVRLVPAGTVEEVKEIKAAQKTSIDQRVFDYGFFKISNARNERGPNLLRKLSSP